MRFCSREHEQKRQEKQRKEKGLKEEKKAPRPRVCERACQTSDHESDLEDRNLSDRSSFIDTNYYEYSAGEDELSDVDVVYIM